MVLSVCAVVLVIWLVAAATGPQAYAAVQGAIASWIGQIVLFGCTFAFFLHLCGGIRHLVWDTVHGFELRSIYISGMGRRGGERGAHRGGLDRQLLVARIEPMDRQHMRSPLARAMGLGSAKEGVGALVGGAGFGGRSRPADAVVRRLDHRAYRQRLRDVHRLAENAARRHPDDPASDCAFLSHGAWSAGRDRGLRPFRDQVRGGDCCASWLLRPRDRGCRSHPAHRAQRLRGTVRALRQSFNGASAVRPVAMDRKHAWSFG